MIDVHMYKDNTTSKNITILRRLLDIKTVTKTYLYKFFI